MRLVTRTLFASARLFGNASKLFQYFTVASLSLADLKQGTLRVWEGFNRREADSETRLMPWEDHLIDQFIKPGDAVLLIGSGSGRDLIPLAERGCRVTGVDPVPMALEIAHLRLRERGLSATLIEGFFEDVTLSGRFAVVMFSYYCYSLIPESRRRVGALRKAATHLVDGGHILLSYAVINRPRPIIIRLARTVGALCRSDWRLEPGDLASQSGSIYYYMHAFSPEEIATEATAAGLRVVNRHDFPDETVTMTLVAS